MANYKFPGPCVEYPEPDLEFLRETASKVGAQFYTRGQIVKAPAELWMQNTADWHHLNKVHSEFSGLFDSAPYGVCISKNRKLSYHKLKIRPDVVGSFKYILKTPNLPDFFLHVIKSPYTSLTNFMDVFFSEETVTPHGDKCHVQTKFFTSNQFSVPAQLKDLARVANKKVLQEDKELCEKWAPHYKITSNWLPGEERIRAYLQSIGKLQ